MKGFKVMSKYTETMYVIPQMLAHMGLTGGVLFGSRGGGRGQGISNLCSLGRKYSLQACMFLGVRNGSMSTSAKAEEKVMWYLSRS